MTALKIEIDAHEVVDLAAAWRKAPEMVAEELTRSVLESELLLEREAKEGTPTASGILRGSISAREPRRLADRVIGVVGTSIAYAIPVELGTRPHWPPVQPLIDWARVKLGLPQEEAEDVGFLVARKISVKGTEGAHMFQLAFDRNRGQVETIMGRGLRRIAGRLAEVK